jgi:hypothetical protein
MLLKLVLYISDNVIFATYIVGTMNPYGRKELQVTSLNEPEIIDPRC